MDEPTAEQMAIQWITAISGDKETNDIHFDYLQAIELFTAGFHAGVGSELLKKLSERIQES